MDKEILEEKIKSRGEEFFEAIRGESPSIFNKEWWAGKVMDWAMQNEGFKVRLFRFVDVLPCLTTEESLSRHVAEYFGTGEQEIPAVFRWGANREGVTGNLTARLLAATLRKNIVAMARQFIIGENIDEGIESLNQLRQDGFAFTVDILGEAAVSEREAAGYQEKYLTLLARLEKEQQRWPGLDAPDAGADWGCAPRINLSIKPTSFYSQTDPAAFDHSVEAIRQCLLPVLRRAKALDAFICIDMEQYRYKDITLELYRRLKATPEFRNYPHLGIVLQTYLHDTSRDLTDLLAWARSEQVALSVRLVKGAYWDYETITARQNGWASPVFTVKAETDAAFERLAQTILENSDICHLACASHNIRTISAVMERAAALKVPDERYEFQVLYGMAGPIKQALRKIARRVRLYCAYGELLPGMGYLVRRLLENTSNESFLRRKFLEEADNGQLMVDPAIIAARAAAATEEKERSPKERGKISPFRNQPQADFTRQEVRQGFMAGIAAVRKNLGRTYPLLIGGEEYRTADTRSSVNPANPEEIVGRVCQAGPEELGRAIDCARQAMPGWQNLPAEARAEYLFRAATIARRDIFELAAWQILEVGKQSNQAYADIAEAIDFLEYYGREMIRLGKPRRLGNLPGELNYYRYRPKGLAAVIGPWNFPMAISCGMSAAALVTGNCVLYKPSGLSSVTGYLLAKVFAEAGLPPGVFNFVPGRGSIVGDLLTGHPAVNLIAFTGSVEVGTRIVERAGRTAPGQTHLKKVIAEMGGKNAIIIDDDADLDLAVPQVLASAFGYQGQKCSACSRVIIVEPVYQKFVQRLLEAAGSLPIGPAEDPVNFMGPVVDQAAQRKIMDYIGIAHQEGTVILSRKAPEGGYYVPLTMVAGITPEQRLAREEIFGPVLALMKVPDFDTAIKWANSTPYALTGGVFSRSPQHLDLARQAFKAGNLYLNRGITGALVGRQPFGGFGMSGIGSKAGGPDYLLQFMDPVSDTENTMRRGFAPVSSEDEGF
jgi:RHH-type proline utilization regulon transcriptional repressor/proline dehydrogenase/delta 1-pyrroline-5-carboxylate dehydrogenase